MSERDSQSTARSSNLVTPDPWAVEKCRDATLIEYEHGGGRLYYEGKNGRELIADFYNANTRDYIMSLIRGSAHETGADPARPRMHVTRICTAYESGFGRGESGRDLAQPYAAESDESTAYFEGWTLGRQHAVKTSSNQGESNGDR